MIPKIANIVWLGGEMPDREQIFLTNNKMVLSDYKINLWGNDNYHELFDDAHLKEFVDNAIQIKKYAFAADVIKLVALQKYGGWSLDADNEVLQTFDDFLHLSFVSGFEKFKRYSPITAVWGAIPNHKFTNLLLEQYHLRDFNYLTTKPNTQWITEILIAAGAINNNSQQYIESLDVHLYPDYVFCGPKAENKTYSLHHFNGSWL